MSRHVIRLTGGDIDALVFDSEASMLEVYDEVPSGTKLEDEPGDPLIQSYFGATDAHELSAVTFALLREWEE